MTEASQSILFLLSQIREDQLETRRELRDITEKLESKFEKKAESLEVKLTEQDNLIKERLDELEKKSIRTLAFGVGIGAAFSFVIGLGKFLFAALKDYITISPPS